MLLYMYFFLFCTLSVSCDISVCDGCTLSSKQDTDFKCSVDGLSDVLSYKMSHIMYKTIK